MRHNNLVRALNKVGVQVETAEEVSGLMVARYNGKVLEWYETNDRASLLRLRRETDHDDLRSDYHAGYFVRTIKDAVAGLTENAVLRVDHQGMFVKEK